MNRIPEKLRNIGCKVKEKQCFIDYVSYLSTLYFAIFLEYGSCSVKPLFTSMSGRSWFFNKGTSSCYNMNCAYDR
jgi:hypothetical protein